MKKICVSAIFFAYCACAASDWPQLQGNPQRTGYTPDCPEPPWEVAWTYDFAAEREDVNNVVQAIVCQDTVFVGTRHGSLHAIDAATGKLKWRFTGCGPIQHTAAAADGLVIFGALDGLYALHAADGELAWKYAGERINGFGAAPLLAEGKVFIAERAGIMHALDLKTGAALWSAPFSAPVYQSAAYAAPPAGEQSGMVFIGAEDMVLRCLSAADGREIWNSGPLNGQSFRDYHPVVTPEGRVVVRTWNPVPYATLLPTDEGASWGKWPEATVARSKAAWDEGKYMPATARNNEVMLEWLTAPGNEHVQMLYVFNIADGKQPFVPIHNNSSSIDGPVAPICLDADGHWIQPLGLTTSAGYVRLDQHTGLILDFLTEPGKCQSNTDEVNNFTVGGRICFMAQAEEGEAGHFAAYDLAKAAMLPIPGVMKIIGWNYDYNAQSSGNAFSIGNDRFFHICNHCLICRRSKTGGAQ